ncbi:hypothetical protein L195_g019972 [Trifolium pratense]|uniref:Uncharacterized protein n=1 Tax=Trifolium pratense TaxID=57577 RepID=A0A2K3N197_TRIPR|nr:hypothetical protein L195_g019972 [Trifolium pratense]
MILLSGVLPDILRKTPKLEVLYIPTVVREYLDGEDSEIQLANVEKVADIQDQLQSVGLGTYVEACCGLGHSRIIIFNSPSDYESPDDESDEDEGANSGVFPGAGFMQESSSAGSAASPNRFEQPDTVEMWQLLNSEQRKQIVQEEFQQAFEEIIESRWMDEMLHHYMLMLSPFLPHYDKLQIPRMQESSSAVSVSSANTGQSQQPDIEEMRRPWKIVREYVQQEVREIIESKVRKMVRKMVDEMLLPFPPHYYQQKYSQPPPYQHQLPPYPHQYQYPPPYPQAHYYHRYSRPPPYQYHLPPYPHQYQYPPQYLQQTVLPARDD